MTFTPAYRSVHNCLQKGYHKLGQPRYLDGSLKRFVRHCRYCSYVFAGLIEQTESGQIKVSCINVDVGRTRQSDPETDKSQSQDIETSEIEQKTDTST